jgi:hypothetical protein
MLSVLRSGFFVLTSFVPLSSTALAAGPACAPIEGGQLRCTIETVADCEQIEDYPYARKLFCPAAFSAVREMVSEVAASLGAAGPSSGSFYYYQTLAGPPSQSQTTAACLETEAPWGSDVVEGGGAPLCHLVAYATSPGPVTPDVQSANPVPEPLRGFPAYFRKLYAPGAAFPLSDFRTGGVFDPVVEGLGAAGHAEFVADYPAFSPSGLYDPDQWSADSEYRGISGGGGGGWGGEIALVSRPRGRPRTLLAFGGGGGGGMTSLRTPAGEVVSSLGAGGGGGMQFGNAYRAKTRKIGGLGLGAGASSAEETVQYSYNDYARSGRPPRPVNVYDAELIRDYETQLAGLGVYLRGLYGNGRTIMLMGGGGQGGGTEYLMSNGEQHEPHALSTQAGFQFSYEFGSPALRNESGLTTEVAALLAEQQDFYQLLGDDFRVANDRSFEECGRDYSNYACMCPRAHAIVICLAGQQLGSPDEIPAWLQEQHCPAEPSLRPSEGFTSYQRLLLQSAGKPGSECARVLRDYFTRVNTPVDIPAELRGRGLGR